ncbi:hypothetical protein TWF694_005883 [Orbilia ellipsospora]|uniref:DUF5071 domain-containing protein n=1 Tax=Orbilia ellipsospora TaxID=2528407 RepID=A0AAV9WSA6_9PEZI
MRIYYFFRNQHSLHRATSASSRSLVSHLHRINVHSCVSKRFALVTGSSPRVNALRFLSSISSDSPTYNTIPMASVDNIDIAALEQLGPREFGNCVEAFFLAAGQRFFESQQYHGEAFPEKNVILSRANEAPTITAITNILAKTARDRQAFYVTWTAFYKILNDLPLDTLESYRPALEVLAAIPKVPFTEYYSLAWGNLAHQAGALLRFLNDRDAVWVPEIKQDTIAFRSLQERVTSSEEMRPHVRGLLSWLADPNWPPYQGCWKQLARFPEATIEEIASMLEKERGDGWWISNVLGFVDACVPLELWEELKPKMDALVESSQGDEDDSEVAQEARAMLDRYDAWLQERLGRMASGS